jgi:hypothetical protein
MAYSEMHIDHILPEELSGTDELAGILNAFGLDPGFNLNRWCNWLPAHGTCNQQKKAHVFKPSPIILVEIERAIDKAQSAQKVHDEFNTDRKLSIALDRVLDAVETGKMSQVELAGLLGSAAKEHESHRTEDLLGTPIMFAPGLRIVQENAGSYLLEGRSGLIGARPKGDHLDSSWDCPNSGPTGWNGTRCIQCGYLIEPD